MSAQAVPDAARCCQSRQSITDPGEALGAATAMDGKPAKPRMDAQPTARPTAIRHHVAERLTSTSLSLRPAAIAPEAATLDSPDHCDSSGRAWVTSSSSSVRDTTGSTPERPACFIRSDEPTPPPTKMAAAETRRPPG